MKISREKKIIKINFEKDYILRMDNDEDMYDEFGNYVGPDMDGEDSDDH